MTEKQLQEIQTFINDMSSEIKESTNRGDLIRVRELAYKMSGIFDLLELLGIEMKVM